MRAWSRDSQFGYTSLLVEGAGAFWVGVLAARGMLTGGAGIADAACMDPGWGALLSCSRGETGSMTAGGPFIPGVAEFSVSLAPNEFLHPFKLLNVKVDLRISLGAPNTGKRRADGSSA